VNFCDRGVGGGWFKGKGSSQGKSIQSNRVGIAADKALDKYRFGEAFNLPFVDRLQQAQGDESFYRNFIQGNSLFLALLTEMIRYLF
jgi:hypothetical protein